MQDKSIELATFSAPPGQGGRIFLTQELIERFLAHLHTKGRTPETVATYRSYLNRIYRYLPDDREIGPGTLEQLWNKMESEGFSTNTINVSISAANSLLEYCGRRDLQLPRRVRDENAAQPELTRAEYQELLRAARRDGKEQAYMLVKLFACTGINLHELDEVTAEAVHAGKVMVKAEKGGMAELKLPRCLCDELENYMERQDIISGPVFVSRTGQPLNRATVSRIISSLAESARIPREKCNPRCLQRLYSSTQETIEKSIFLQARQMYEYLLDQGQQVVGWTVRAEMPEPKHSGQDEE